MKIYTEINYQWLDNQIVKTSSKSFEYDGEISLCMGGGGGGGGDPITKAITKVADTTTAVVTDPVGTTAGAVSTGLEAAGGVVEDYAGAASDIADKISDPILEGMSTGGEVIGDNMSDALDAMNTNLEYGLEGIASFNGSL